jgi:hypothetical protein
MDRTAPFQGVDRSSNLRGSTSKFRRDGRIGNALALNTSEPVRACGFESRSLRLEVMELLSVYLAYS